MGGYISDCLNCLFLLIVGAVVYSQYRPKALAYGPVRRQRKCPAAGTWRFWPILTIRISRNLAFSDAWDFKGLAPKVFKKKYLQPVDFTLLLR